MTKAKKLAALSSDELVSEYVRISTDMGQAADQFETARYNRLFAKEIAVVRELRSRDGDHRNRLFSLYGHQNLQVRLNAAHSTYPLDPSLAAAELQAIAATKWPPQGTNAGMTLAMIRMGISKLHDDSWI